MQCVLASDVVLDAGHISWGARLSTHYPTVEVRVTDAQMSASNTVLIALIVRSLVDTSFDGAPPLLASLADVLDLAQWQAAKFGLHGNQFDPLDGRKTPGRTHAEQPDGLQPARIEAPRRHRLRQRWLSTAHASWNRGHHPTGPLPCRRIQRHPGGSYRIHC